MAAARGCVLQVRGVESGLAVRGDADALLRVLTNLLDNAIRHGRGRVVLGAHRENGAVRLEVVDDGPGFAPDDLDHVFEPLFRSDRARAPAHRGHRARPGDRPPAGARARRRRRRPPTTPRGGARATLTLPAARP